MTLDRATRKMLEEMATTWKPMHESTLEEARSLGEMHAALMGTAPAMGRIENHKIAVPGGAVAIRVLVPKQPVRGVMVYYHGGGWVMGSIDEYETIARKLAERTSCAVVLVGYRLAPEHRYPVAVDDSYAALEWVAERLNAIAGRTDVPLIVAGDSAGSNLAAVMAIRARDRDGPRIALQVLVYPATDATFDRPSHGDPENQLLLPREDIIWCWDHYVPDRSRRTEVDASPLRCADLSRLPPAVMLTAEHDVLRDEGEAYAARLTAAGVPVDLKRHVGQLHGFFTLLVLPGSEAGFQQVVKAVRACIVHHSKVNLLCEQADSQGACTALGATRSLIIQARETQTNGCDREID